MVAKIGSGSSILKVLYYNQNKVDKGEAKVLSQNLMRVSADGNYSVEVCLKSFNPYLWVNRQTKKPVLHISLNPNPNDNISDEQLTEMAHEYMEKMGYGNQPFLVYKHEDIDRHHLHIVSLRIDENGKKLDHNFENKRSMRICRDLENKFELIPTDKKKVSTGFPIKKVDYKKGNIKQQIANVIIPAARDWHFQSLKEYKALLSVFNVEMIEVRGAANGQQYKGIVYAATDDKGEVVGSPIKSSKFSKELGVAGLEKRIEKSKEHIRNKKLKERPKDVISQIFKNSTNRKGFEIQLLKQGISVLFRKNESGRIYGATFIDHKQKFVFNGSRLGKDFSANVFNERFGTQNENQEEKSSSQIDTSKYTNQAESIFENLSGLLGFEPLGENYEEENFIRRIKRKKKRQRKL